ENEDKSIEECLDILIKQLRKTQRGLSPEFRTEGSLRDKIINACNEVEACVYACLKPAPTLEGVCSDLRSSIIAYKRIHESKPSNQAFYTDRKYRTGPRPQNRSDRQNNRYQGKSSNNFKKRCLVCKKEGCWSTKHPEKERKEAMNKLNRKFQQFCIDVEGEPPEDSQDNSSDNDEEEEGMDDKLESFVFEATFPSPETSPNMATTFITESMDEINGKETAIMLANQSTVHALTGDVPDANIWFTTSTRYGPQVFQGVIVDTGAAGCSTGGYSQFIALQKHQNRELQINKAKMGTVTVQFGIGATTSIGSVEVDTPIGVVEFHIVEANTPFLLCLHDMDRLGAYFNNLTNKVHHGDKTYSIIRRFGHAFMTWGRSLTSYIAQTIYLSESELRQLHRRFGHPSARRFADLLHRSDHDIDRKAIERLTKHCTMCQKYGGSPRRFKFTLRDPDLQFNHTIIVDIMYIDPGNSGRNPVLHIVDEATRFQAARWLKDISSQTVWNTLRLCWIDTYLGPPDIIGHDAGTQFMSDEFRQLAGSMAVSTEPVPVEAHNSIGIVERYHLPLRRAYTIIAEELKGISGINKEMVLQMAVKAVNDTAGPNGLVPTLLVFGAYPRMAKLDPPAPSIAVRSKAIEKAMAEVSKLRINRQITDALRQRNGPQTDRIHELPINSRVWVWRENRGWTGPHTLLSTEGETCNVQLPSGPVRFRTTVVKPYVDGVGDDGEFQGIDEIQHEGQEESAQEPERTGQDSDETQLQSNQIRRNPIRQRRMPERYRQNVTTITTFLSNKEMLDLELSKRLRAEGKITTEGPPFFLSRQKEIDGLIAKGVFEIATNEDNTGRLFKSRFVDEIKGKATNCPFEKSRLVIQAYNDDGKREILTQSPTIQRVSQRIVLCIAASTEFDLYLRDVSQAYVQSKTNLNRDVFAKPPKEIADTFPPNAIMRIEKPLYGIPEAGTHWFRTYHRHHSDKLFMVQSTYDPCLLHTEKEGLFGVVGMQTDDTLFVGNKAFAELENDELKKAQILAKPIEMLTMSNTLIFNGGKIHREGMTIKLTQKKQGDRIELIDVKKAPFREAYVAQRARGAYIATVCQPEAAFDLSVAAQSQNPSDDDAKALNKRLKWQMKNKERGLRFINIGLGSAKLFVFVDASFANNRDYSSQIGFVIVLANEDINDGSSGRETFKIDGNIVHWSSIKCKRVTRSVLASEFNQNDA
ncbi:hypothetical protein Egran_03132, partial [Elaphomyces granulatus]